jgi:L-fucose isomerase-like protein
VGKKIRVSCNHGRRDKMKKNTFGLVVGNRGFFPDHLVAEGRSQILSVLKKAGYGTVCLGPEETKLGAVETLEEAGKCADLFKSRASEIDGVIVTLPNFGDERAVADTLRNSGLSVPVLVHAFPDELGRMSSRDRRDSFCGKISVCNNLRQYGIPFSLTDEHTMSVEGDAFLDDLRLFAATCRVVKGLRGVRIGAIGARPAAFNTVRFSEKILEQSGISVETIDLSEVFGNAGKLGDKDSDVKKKVAAIETYCGGGAIPRDALLRMAKFSLVVDRWMLERRLAATAVQCWTAIEEFFGVTPCAVMGMMSNTLMPSACEVDVTGAVAMYALTLASETPSALLDWNNNYSDDPDECVLFHCSNLPKAVFKDFKIGNHEILKDTIGEDKAAGTCVGTLKPGPISLCRVTTDDSAGCIRTYLAEGEVIDNPLNTFGGVGVTRIGNLQDLLAFICFEGFEHHVAMTYTHVAEALYEAFTTYMGWETYFHEG